MRTLEHSDFEPYVGNIFFFTREWEEKQLTAELVLTHTTLYSLQPNDRRSTDTSGKYRNVPFSAFFEGAHPTPLPQGLYQATRLDTEEPMDIFITCRGPNDEGTAFIYEAVYG